MKTFQRNTLALALSILLGACGTGPVTSTSLLAQTRSDYQTAQANPQVATYAALEMKLASEALAKAETAAQGHESLDTVDKLAYLAKQKIAVAQEVANQKAAEADAANAGKARDQVRLDQRTLEANQARASTLVAEQKTQMAQQDAANAQLQAQDAQQRAAALEAQLQAINAKKTERGFVITLSDVLFGSDQARLNADGMRSAQKLADFLRDNPQRTVLIEGFTDNTGSTAHNQSLSERRANTVNIALQDMGVSAGRVTARGLGESFPVAANDSAKDRQLNRRVEIILSDENGKVIAR